jgi:uncharacterized protein (DUF983 family)
MASYSFPQRLEALRRGLFLLCPNCGQGKMFNNLFQMNPTCPYCHVRYERQSGESVGGMYLNLILAELITMGGFFIVNAVWSPPFWPHFTFWIIFNIVFVILFYRHARALWVSVVYLAGGVQPDPDYERQYTRHQNE